METMSLRRRIAALLGAQDMDARELAQELGLTEKEVGEHLTHVARSVIAARGTFIVTPCRCLLCGFVFADRRRLARPGRCPQCRRSKLQGPSFRIC